MAVALEDLIPYLKSSLNAPGAEFFVAEDVTWTAALANAFWWARLKGYFASYRTDADGENILPVAPETADLPRVLQQIVVAIAAINAIEARLLSLPTSSRAKAGPVEVETQHAATLLIALLKARRDDLQAIKEEIVGSQWATSVSVIDAVLSREGAYMTGQAAWVR